MNRLSICIAEDSKVVRSAIQSLLTKSGYFELVGAASNGREALMMCKDTKPQVALLDVSMPEMNGIEAARQICAISPETVIIMLSSHDDMEVIREALKAGARDFIRKPVHGPELVQKILTIYNREGSRRPSTSDTGRRKILGFLGPKAGVGATTVAVNSAVLLAKKLNKKVLLLDLDFCYGDLSHCLGGKREHSLADLLKQENAHQMQTIQRYVIQNNLGVHLLGGPTSPEPEALDEGIVSAILRTVEPAYDYVVVDIPPALNEKWGRLLGSLDQLVVTVADDLPSIRSAKVCLEVLKRMNYPARKIKVVYNHVAGSGGIGRKDLQDFINFPVFSELSHDREAVSKAYLARAPFAATATADNQLVTDLQKFVERLFTAQEKL